MNKYINATPTTAVNQKTINVNGTKIKIKFADERNTEVERWVHKILLNQLVTKMRCDA
jgi:hypothetical protein